jgi:hypothetical protein
MTRDDGKQTDELFVRIRLQLLEIRKSDPQVVEEIKSLLSQLEDSVESLVIDSMRLRNLEQSEKKSARKKRLEPSGNQ